MKLKFLFAFLFLFLPLQTLALGLSVEPASLEISYPQNKQEQLKITNISSEPIFVKVQADALVENIKIDPKEFNLLPEETMLVNLDLAFSQQDSLLQKTNLSILSQALHPNSFNAISAIKIPLTVSIEEVSGLFKWLVLALAFVILLLILFFIFCLFLLFSKPKRFLDLDFLLHHKWWLFKTGRWHKLWRK